LPLSIPGAIAFGDKTTPSNAPGANGLVSDPTAVSDNNAFIGTRYFALGNDFPNNQYYLFFFQYTVRLTPAPCCSALCHPTVLPQHQVHPLLSPVPRDHHITLLLALSPQFAATACTIVSGAIAERAKFESYILYSFFMAAWVYPVVVHSMWSSSSYIGAFRQVPVKPLHASLLLSCQELFDAGLSSAAPGR
jgi:Ammonium Transporter Family